MKNKPNPSEPVNGDPVTEEEIDESARPIYFKTLFPEQLKDWQRQQKEDGKPHTQKEFKRRLRELWFEDHPNLNPKDHSSACPITDSYVSKWIKGSFGIPYAYIPYIAKVFGISKEVYYPQTHDQKYENVSSFVTKIGKDNAEFARQEGLNLDFTRSLSMLVDFDSLFPLYIPVPDREESVLPQKREHSTSAPIDSDLQFLQVQRDGKTVTLHKCDLMFLKEVQDKVKLFVEFLLFQRSEEMKRETNLFNAALRERKLNPEEVPGVIVRDICREIDRFMPIAEGKTIKDGIPVTHYRRATQEDWDNLFKKGGQHGKNRSKEK